MFFLLLVMQGDNHGKPLQDVLTLDRTDSWSGDDLTGWNRRG